MAGKAAEQLCRWEKPKARAVRGAVGRSAGDDSSPGGVDRGQVTRGKAVSLAERGLGEMFLGQGEEGRGVWVG